MPDPRLRNVDPKLPILALFGDSLTEYSFFVNKGTGDELSQRFQGKANVLNFGYAGRTTENLRGVFKNHIVAKLPRAPLMFTIWLGANDATLGYANVPIDDFEKYLREYVDQIIKHPSWDPAPKVVLMTPPPINVGHLANGKDEEEEEEEELDIGSAMASAMQLEREAAATGIGHRTWKSKRTYAERVMQIANSYPKEHVAGLDVWTLFTQAALDKGKKKWDEDKLPGCGLPGAKPFPNGYFTDGLHLGEVGYEIVTEALLVQVEQQWPGLFKDLQ